MALLLPSTHRRHRPTQWWRPSPACPSPAWGRSSGDLSVGRHYYLVSTRKSIYPKHPMTINCLVDLRGRLPRVPSRRGWRPRTRGRTWRGAAGGPAPRAAPPLPGHTQRCHSSRVISYFSADTYQTEFSRWRKVLPNVFLSIRGYKIVQKKMETIKQILLVTFARNQLVFSKKPILEHGIRSLLYWTVVYLVHPCLCLDKCLPECWSMKTTMVRVMSSRRWSTRASMLWCEVDITDIDFIDMIWLVDMCRYAPGWWDISATSCCMSHPRPTGTGRSRWRTGRPGPWIVFGFSR